MDRWLTMWLRILVLSFLLLSSELYALDTLKVSAVLDTIQKEISGSVSIRFDKNQIKDDIIFQLFPNLYSKDKTPDSFRNSRLYRTLESNNQWGGIEIDSALIGGINCTDSIQIKDMSVTIPSRLSDSRAEGTIQLHFTTYLPGQGSRLFYNENEYLLDGWFPYPAPIDSLGHFKMPQYGNFTELVGDYYYYGVELTTPANLKIAAAIEPLSEEIGDSLLIHRFAFGPAHDFALAISPDFMVDTFVIDETRLTIYYHDYDIDIIPRIFQATSCAFEYMTENLGHYAYDNLTLAIINSGFSGGVEFPGLIALTSPKGTFNKSNMYEFLTVHEIVHQWSYGMIGSDQVEEPWLDESITSYFTLKIAEKYWLKESNLVDFAGMKISERDMYRLNHHVISEEQPINNPAYSFIDESEYYGTIYAKGPLAVETFFNIMPDSLDAIFWKSYYNRFKFSHVTTDSFIELVQKIYGEKNMQVADYLFTNIYDIDYSVKGIVNRPLDSTGSETIIRFGKTGQLTCPIDYDLILANNDTLSFIWDAKNDHREITYNFDTEVITAIVDPKNKITVDNNLLNNSLTVSVDHRPGLRLSSGLMFLIESFFSFVGGL